MNDVLPNEARLIRKVGWYIFIFINGNLPTDIKRTGCTAYFKGLRITAIGAVPY